MAKRFPLNPPHPERNCWGCDRYCKAGDMLCGNGSNRTQHPIETLGPDWAEILGMSPPNPAADPALPSDVMETVPTPAPSSRLA